MVTPTSSHFELREVTHSTSQRYKMRRLHSHRSVQSFNDASHCAIYSKSHCVCVTLDVCPFAVLSPSFIRLQFQFERCHVVSVSEYADYCHLLHLDSMIAFCLSGALRTRPMLSYLFHLAQKLPQISPNYILRPRSHCYIHDNACYHASMRPCTLKVSDVMFI